MIDPRLRTLQLVAHHGSVSAAAAALHFTPSAVSQQLRTLSEEYGVPVAQQVGRRMEPTAAGRVLLRHLVVLTAEAERTRAELAEIEQTAGTAGLCGFSTGVGALLAPSAAALKERFPDLAVRVVEAEPERCVDLLLSGDCDLALLVVDDRTPPTTDARFEQRSVLDDPIDLAVPVGHPLTQRARVTLRDADAESWIMAWPGDPYHRLAMTACQAAGFRPEVSHYAHEWDTGAAMVAHGLGIFLLPRLAPMQRTDDVVRIPLVGPSAPVRRIAALTRAGSSEAPVVAHALASISEIAATVLTE